MASKNVLTLHSFGRTLINFFKLVKISKDCHGKFTAKYPKFLSSNLTQSKMQKKLFHLFNDLGTVLTKHGPL